MDKYDVIIIGGGISGLFSAYKIQKLHPDKSIVILEKEKFLGGRMDTYKFYNTTINTGAGIGRKEKDGVLIKLLNELKIDYNEYPIDMKYSDTIQMNDTNTIYSDIDVSKTIGLLKRKYNKKEFARYTFERYAKHILGTIVYKLFVIKLGFSDFEEADAFDVLHYYGLDDNRKGGTGLSIRWSLLIEKIAEKISSNKIKLSSEVISLTQHNEYFFVNTLKTTFLTKKVIIASAVDTVCRLLPTFKIYEQVHGQSFLRVYGKFSKPIPELNTYTIVPGPLKKIIPINIKDCVYMIAYSDNEDAKFLNKYSKNNAKNRDFYCNLIEEALRLNSKLELMDFKSFYWEIGTHYYEPLHKEYKNRLEFIDQAQHPYKNLLVVGEMIAVHQGWTLGALESVDSVVSSIWLKT
jgi:protoporphyrinogen oxidase